MKANIIKLSVLVVLLISSLSVFSQDKAMISGKILSTEKEIVDFATVYLKGTSYGGTTNQEGIYHIKAPAGNYTLIVSAIGYKTVETESHDYSRDTAVGRSDHCFYRGDPFEEISL